MAQAKQDMGTGSIKKLMLQLMIPAVVAQVVNLLYNIVDRIYIGHIAGIGAAALTGVGLFTPILMLLNAFAMLVGAGGAPRTAIALGQGDRKQAEKIISNSFTMLLLFSVVLTIGFYAGAPVLLRLFGASDATLPYALSYSRIYIAGSVFVLVVLGILALIVLITWVNGAERRIPVQYAKRQVGRKMYGGQSSTLPMKVNMSGVLPVIFASSILSIPSTIAGFMHVDPQGIMGKILSVLRYDHWVYAVLYFFLIMAFNYFYISIQYNPMEIANNLRKNNGTIPGIRPGKPTADFIARVVSKVTVVGGIFLAIIAIGPILLSQLMGINISLGGTSIIIVVGVALDTVRQLESQMMMRHYKGFLE